MSDRRSDRIHTLQALRAIAAWLVVIDHVLLEVTDNNPALALTHLAWTLGSTGVGIFFVMSGFIMVHVSWTEFGVSGAPLRFLRRRATRIIPLYWAGTLAAFAYHKVMLTHGADDGVEHIVRSLLFIPYENADGSWMPILPQGWTLIYEAYFYTAFTAALLVRRAAGLIVVGAVIFGMVLARPLISSATLEYFADPITLLFLAGIALAVLWRHWGLREPAILARLARPLERLGDASYATYLVQGFVLSVMLRLWVAAVGAPSLALLPVSLAVVTIVGLLTHAWIERPILAFYATRRRATALLRGPA